MDVLKDILNAIMDIYNQDLDNETKHNLLASLWTKYYKLSSQLDVNLPFAYNLYLLGENESYIIYQEPERKEIDKIEALSMFHIEYVSSDSKIKIVSNKISETNHFCEGVNAKITVYVPKGIASSFSEASYVTVIECDI